MKALVDQERCIGCGTCIDLCSEVFSWDRDKAVVTMDPVVEDFQDLCREAARVCPVEVIYLQTQDR
jgi:ferredoxin